MCGSNYTFEAAYGTWGYKLTTVPKKAADAASTVLESGTTYVTPSTAGSGVRRTTTSNAVSLVNRTALLLPMMLSMLYVGKMLR